MRLAILALAALPVFAAIQGTVINKTTGKPQEGVTFLLLKLGEGGMTPAGGSRSGPGGTFKLESDTASQYLLQATWHGVTYNMPIPPGTATTGLELAVFDSAPAVEGVKVTQHMLLVETDGQELVVNETLIYENKTNMTLHDAKGGAVRFFVPSEVGQNLRARVIAPGGMPVERTLEKTREKDVWSVDFPVRPGGETRFDVSYKMPVKQPLVLAGRVLPADAPLRFVIPQGITAQGEGLSQIGTEPSSQAAIFEVKAKAYKVALAGTGQLQNLQATERNEQEGPRIAQIMPPGYDRVWKWALGLMIAILALGFWAQYLKPAPGAPSGKAGKGKA